MTVPARFFYQWLRNGQVINGANGVTYTVQSADTGDTLSCVVTAVNIAGGSTLSVTGNVVIPGGSAVAVTGMGTITLGGHGTPTGTGGINHGTVTLSGSGGAAPGSSSQGQVVQSPVTLVQASGVTSVHTNTLNPVTPGNTLILALLVGAGATISSVTGLGATWTKIASVSDAANTCGQLFFYEGVSGAGSGYVTVTTAASSFFSVGVFEVADVASLDFSAYNVNNTSTVTSSTSESLTLNPVAPNDLLFAMVRGTSNVTAGPSNYVTDGGYASVAWATDATTAAEPFGWTQAAAGVYMILGIGLTGAPVNITRPTLSPMSVAVGSVITINYGSWSGSPVFTQSWLRDGVTISGATGATYTAVSLDVGHVITAVINASNGAGYAAPITTAPTSTVASGATAVPSNTTAPSITGIPETGQPLTANVGSWTNYPTSYAIQWYQVSTSGGGVTPTPVQSQLAYGAGSSATVAVGMVSSVTAGHLLTLASTEYDQVAISSVTGGGTWTKALSGINSPGGAGLQELWYCLNATGGTTVVNVVYASTPSAEHAIAMVTEWNVTGATLPSSASSSASGTSATISSPSHTPAAGDLVIAMQAGESSPGSPSSGWYPIPPAGGGPSGYYDPNYNVSAVAYIVATSTSAVQCSWTAGASDPFNSLICAFRPPAAGSGLTAISGATATTYTPTSTDVGYQLEIKVTASNGQGPSTPVYSSATAAVTSSGAILEGP